MASTFRGMESVFARAFLNCVNPVHVGVFYDKNADKFLLGIYPEEETISMKVQAGILKCASYDLDEMNEVELLITNQKVNPKEAGLERVCLVFGVKENTPEPHKKLFHALTSKNDFGRKNLQFAKKLLRVGPHLHPGYEATYYELKGAEKAMNKNYRNYQPQK